MNILDKIRNEQVKAERHEFNVGDTTTIWAIMMGPPT